MFTAFISFIAPIVKAVAPVVISAATGILTNFVSSASESANEFIGDLFGKNKQQQQVQQVQAQYETELVTYQEQVETELVTYQEEVNKRFKQELQRIEVKATNTINRATEKALKSIQEFELFVTELEEDNTIDYKKKYAAVIGKANALLIDLGKFLVQPNTNNLESNSVYNREVVATTALV